LTHKRAANLDDAVDVLTNRLKRNETGEISLNNFDAAWFFIGLAWRGKTIVVSRWRPLYTTAA
jgi:hypothetical protein